MGPNCILELFAIEIIDHIRNHPGCTMQQLLGLIGPDHKKWEFWSALRFNLNSKIYVTRDAHTQQLRLELIQSRYVHNNPGEWYMFEQHHVEGVGTLRFYIPPIRQTMLRQVLLRGGKKNSLKASLRRLLAQFPELWLFDEEQVIAEIIAPVLLEATSRKAIPQASRRRRNALLRAAFILPG